MGRKKKRKKRGPAGRSLENLKNHPVYGHSNWRLLKRFVNLFFGRVCLRCGKKTGMFHADHVVPYSWDKSRAFDPTNLQQLCAGCNKWKGGRHMDFRMYLPCDDDLIRLRVSHLVPGYKAEPKDAAHDARAAVIRIRNGIRKVL